jgi:hypothetical protein
MSLDKPILEVIFFATIHPLNNTSFPFKLLFGLENY